MTIIMMKFYSRRGQSSLEMIIILSLLLSVLLLILVSNTSVLSIMNAKYNNDITNSALDDVANAASFVYQQGEGAKKQVYVTLPDTLRNVTLNDSYIEAEVFVKEGNTQKIYRNFPFSVTGDFPVERGRYQITLEVVNNAVNISY